MEFVQRNYRNANKANSANKMRVNLVTYRHVLSRGALFYQRPTQPFQSAVYRPQQYSPHPFPGQ